MEITIDSTPVRGGLMIAIAVPALALAMPRDDRRALQVILDEIEAIWDDELGGRDAIARLRRMSKAAAA